MKKLFLFLFISGLAFADCTPTPTGGTGGTGWDTPTETSITFHFTTPSPCTTRIMYGQTDAFGNVTPLADSAGVTNHTITVSGLIPATSNVYYIMSGDPTTGANAKSAPINSGSVISTAPVPSGSLTYTVRVFGNRKLARGYSSIYAVQVYLTQATTPQVYTVKLSGMPSGVTMTANAAIAGACSSGNATATSYDIGYYLCYANSSQFGSNGNTGFTLNASAGATLGAFTLTVEIQSVACPTGCNTTIPITVYDPSFAFSNPASYPSITNISTWNSNLVTYADRWGTIESPPGTYHPQYAPWSGYGVSATCGAAGPGGCAVYYDGAAAWTRINKYAVDHGLSLAGWAYPNSTYIAANSKVYYTFVNTAGPGGIPTLPAEDARFPLGLYEDCVNNGTVDACTAVDYMGNNVGYGASQVAYGVGITPQKIREVIYDSWMARVGDKRGIAGDQANSAADINRMLYMADAIANGYDQDQAGEQPFMDGLLMEGLLKCYYGYYTAAYTAGSSYCSSNYQDPRIPPAVKDLADHLKNTLYDASLNDFWYNASYKEAGSANGANYLGLNMLIIPAYAWLYRTTGDSTYSSFYNSLFGPTALDTGYTWDTGNGKTTTQQLRWGMDGIDCMTAGLPCLGVASAAIPSTTIGGGWTIPGGWGIH